MVQTPCSYHLFARFLVVGAGLRSARIGVHSYH
jgi:hypothetical protein